MGTDSSGVGYLFLVWGWKNYFAAAAIFLPSVVMAALTYFLHRHMSQADDRKFTVDEGEAARNQENLQQEYLSLSQQQAALDQDIARLAQEAELPQPDSAADLEDLEDALDRDIQDLQKWQALRQATEEQEATVKRCDGLD